MYMLLAQKNQGKRMAFQDKVMALRREPQTLSVSCGSPSEEDSTVTCSQPRSGGWGWGVAHMSRVQLEVSIE